jgi:death-on-curing family protein
MTNWLEPDDIRQLCFELAHAWHLDAREPIPPFDTRFPDKLESCLAVPKQSFGDRLLYPTLIDQAAILFYLLNKDHPFVNGNKRIALTTLLVFLYLNGKWLSSEIDGLYAFAVSVAASDARMKDAELKRIKTFIEEHLTTATQPAQGKVQNKKSAPVSEADRRKDRNRKKRERKRFR